MRDTMKNVIKIDAYGHVDNYTVSEVICVKCCKRWIAVRPAETLLKDLECSNCGSGAVIETGQIIDDQYSNCIGCHYDNRGKCKLKLGDYSKYVACEYYKGGKH